MRLLKFTLAVVSLTVVFSVAPRNVAAQHTSAQDLSGCFQCHSALAANCYVGYHKDFSEGDLWQHGNKHGPNCAINDCTWWMRDGGHVDYSPDPAPEPEALLLKAHQLGDQGQILKQVQELERAQLNVERHAVQVTRDDGGVIVHLPLTAAQEELLYAALRGAPAKITGLNPNTEGPR